MTSTNPKDASELSLRLDVKAEGMEPILAAAYLMTDRAYVRVSGDREKTLEVCLAAKRPEFLFPEALAEAFKRELATQKVRWAVAKNNLPVREFVAEQAVMLANGQLPPEPQPAEPPPDQLSDEQRREIEKLIAEVEEEIKTLNQKKAVPDPKNIKASWEEKRSLS
ncbi:MAG: hypothetical protein HY921_02535 [Elusimicrobia bacterium]|nr:hypothetical protein [Elusimicrobiota bacterium]